MAIRRERTHSKVTKPEKLSGAHPKAVHSGDFEMRMCFTFYVVFYCSHRYFNLDKSHGQNMLKNPLIIQGIVEKVNS